MRLVASVLFVLVSSCGVEPRTNMPPQDLDTDPGVDGGVRTDAGTASGDAFIAPSDAIPPGLAPCDEAPYHSDFEWIQHTIFDVSCAKAGCHAGSSPDAGMNLSHGYSHAALVNVPSTHTDGWVRVKPGAPQESMLMVQIGGEAGPPIEGTMPWGQPKLCDPQIDAIRRWIANGALND